MQIQKRENIVVRFPPSPTGEIHIGNVRTLLFNYFFAKKHDGKIVFRFEDTDKERSKKEYEQPMLDALTDLGLSWDEGPYRQTERIKIYNKYLHLLLVNGLAYEDSENATKTGKIIRLKNIEKDIVWNDLVKGEVKINSHSFKERADDGSFNLDGNPDIIIARSSDDPIYHFTVVVDDWLMGVTHVIRGDDHMTSTPRQIMILEALQKLPDLEVPVFIPQYAHLPTIIGEDRKKLSKRNGTTSLKSFFELGYTHEAMVNYLAMLGWNGGDEREFYSLDELVEAFTLERVQVSPAQFDFKKLDNVNKYYLDKMSEVEYLEKALKYFTDRDRKTKKIILKVIRERINKFSEIKQMQDMGDFKIFDEVEYKIEFGEFDMNKICFKGQTLSEAKANLQLIHDIIKDISEESWNLENLKEKIWDWSGTVGRGGVLHPLRTTLSLRAQSPDPFTIMEIIGKKDSLQRISNML